ncbi:response regulator [Bordetella genomosp. 8]|uniref:Response regulator n=1 Tax=Bordetella genomosp. 8 TaxID=1416806 RepID=A0A1W6YQE2_9BORD|nr:response regulator [Bordetella genomosp. 8]ARP83277.1 response regulator [Bordetella genomosp. 8]
MNNAKPLVAIVDDDASVCRAIKRLLSSVGVAADTFATGDAFLETYESIPSYRPACIVLDMQMPGLNGLQVQQRLADSGIPVVFITAHDEADVREHALSGGAAAYLRKPFNDDVFIRAIKASIRSDGDE